MAVVGMVGCGWGGACCDLDGGSRGVAIGVIVVASVSIVRSVASNP